MKSILQDLLLNDVAIGSQIQLIQDTSHLEYINIRIYSRSVVLW